MSNDADCRAKIADHRRAHGSFLARRMKPALRTCVTIENRQSSLSLKLARAANLFRERKHTEPVELANPPQKPTYGHQAFRKRFSI